MDSGDQKPEAPGRGSGAPAESLQSGKVVVVVFVAAAAVLIGGSAALLRWARNRSYESLVHPPGVTAPPSASPAPATSSSAGPQNPPTTTDTKPKP